MKLKCENAAKHENLALLNGQVKTLNFFSLPNFTSLMKFSRCHSLWNKNIGKNTKYPNKKSHGNKNSRNVKQIREEIVVNHQTYLNWLSEEIFEMFRLQHHYNEAFEKSFYRLQCAYKHLSCVSKNMISTVQHNYCIIYLSRMCINVIGILSCFASKYYLGGLFLCSPDNIVHLLAISSTKS